MLGCYRKTISPETHTAGHHDTFIAKKRLREQGQNLAQVWVWRDNTPI